MALPKRNGLGRGLDALPSIEEVNTAGSGSISEIALDRITPNPDQPRREFASEAMTELATSVRELGIIQPISLRDMGNGYYQIIAGERRFRAAGIVGLTTIPAYVRTVEDETMMEMALIENIQREDLNAIEIALSFQKLIDNYNLTQERLSERVGKSRTSIANYLRLLRLPAEVQLALKRKVIEMGHARALLALDNAAQQLYLFEECVKHGFSVRKVEEEVRRLNNAKKDNNGSKKPVSQEYDLLRSHLSSFFKTPVAFTCNNKGAGKISINFKNEAELERIISMFDALH